MLNSDRSSIILGSIILGLFSLVGFYLGYLVIQGIFIPLLFASLMAVVFYPLYKLLLKKINNRIISSLLCCLSLILIVLLVISFVVYLAVGEVVNITKVFTSSIDIQRLEIFTDQEQLQNLLDQTMTNVDALVNRIPFIDTSLTAIVGELLTNIPPLLQEISSYAISFIKLSFDSAAKYIVYLIIFFISFFFLLIDGKKFIEQIFILLPINVLHERQISKRFSNLCYAWIVVSLLMAFIQGSFAAIGFAIIGVPSPFIWGVVTMLASFVPFIGGAVIWGTMGIIYLILGKFWTALFIFLWGAIFISSSDNIIRPFLLREGVKIHPLILFLAVLGGFYAFNVPGLIIGPLIIVFISTLLYIYQLEFGEILKKFHNSK